MRPRRDIAKSLQKAIQQARAHGVLFLIKSTVWRLKTALSKQDIQRQDREGTYTYQDWIEENEPAIAKQTGLENSIHHNHHARIDCLIFPPDSEDSGLRRTCESLIQQNYTDWRAYFIAGASEQVLQHPQDERIQPISIAASTREGMIREAFAASRGDYLLLIQSGDRLRADALHSLASDLEAGPDVDILYFDEDQLAEDGRTRQKPFFKPDWSPELLLSIHYLLRTVLRREYVLRILDKIPTGSLPDLGDLVYRCAEGTARIRHLPQVLVHNGSQPSIEQQRRWTEAHLQRLGLPASTAEIADNGQIRASWEFEQPLISIIIPSRDKVRLLRDCLTSIMERTTSDRYEIVLVDSGSQETETLAYYQELRKITNIRLVSYTDDFNFSAALNLGAKHAQGEVLVFLNNDTQVISGDWLAELARWASRPEIGLVGTKLLFADGTIQHAGIVVGMEGHASHVFLGVREGHSGPFGSVDWYRDYSAVTGACVAVRREVYEELQGFDESYRLVFSDIEICLRAIQAGYRVVYTPFARLIHHEGKTRFRQMPKEDLHTGYLHFLNIVEQGDPFYNPNLSYAVKVPTFRRPGEEPPIQRLKNILTYR